MCSTYAAPLLPQRRASEAQVRCERVCRENPNAQAWFMLASINAQLRQLPAVVDC